MAKPPDHEEIAALYRRYGPMVYGRCLSFLGSEADARDALQEVFVRVLRGAASFRGRARLSTWLYRITTNLCLNRLRDRRPGVPLHEVELPAARDPERRAVVRDLLRRLARQRRPGELEIAIYYFVDGLTQEEIVEVTGLSRRTVGKRIKAFRAATRTLAAAQEES